MLCRMTPPDEPCPAALPVIKPGSYAILVPVCPTAASPPFVIASSNRKKDISSALIPGALAFDVLMSETTIVLPVKVASTSRLMRCFEPLNLSGLGPGGAAIFAVKV